MTRERPVSGAELDALKTLWDAGALTAGEVREMLNVDGREWAYTTAKTILDRLVEKGYVRRHRSSTPHRYSARLSVEDFAAERFGRLRRDLFGDARMPMVRALLGSAELTAEEIAELRAALPSLEGHDEEEST